MDRSKRAIRRRKVAISRLFSFTTRGWVLAPCMSTEDESSECVNRNADALTDDDKARDSDFDEHDDFED